MDNPDLWLWIWLGTALVFGIGEIAAAGSFFLLPFAVGAIVATVAAGLDAPLLIQWILFVGITGGSFLALRPIARRLEAVDPAEGIGARRLIGQTAHLVTGIPAGNADLGMARIGREDWRVESMDGAAIPAGTLVKVVEVRGTRAVVFPVELPSPDDLTDTDPTGTETDTDPPS